MPSSLNELERLKTAQLLAKLIEQCLTENPHPVQAEVSIHCLINVISRWEREVSRLIEHQKLGVHPAKMIAYQAFWIRKLKPISNAYDLRDIQAASKLGKEVGIEKEILDINERVSIKVAVKYLIRYVEKGLIPAPLQPNSIAKPAKATPGQINAYLEKYLYQDSRVFEDLVYNQRYRTFGPHHFTHILDQALFGAALLKVQ